MKAERKAEIRRLVLAELRANGEPMSLRALAYECTVRPGTLRDVLLEMTTEGLIVSVAGYHGHAAWSLPEEGNDRAQSTASRDPISVGQVKEPMPYTESHNPFDVFSPERVARRAEARRQADALRVTIRTFGLDEDTADRLWRDLENVDPVNAAAFDAWISTVEVPAREWAN